MHVICVNTARDKNFLNIKKKKSNIKIYQLIFIQTLLNTNSMWCAYSTNLNDKVEILAQVCCTQSLN